MYILITYVYISSYSFHKRMSQYLVDNTKYKFSRHQPQFYFKVVFPASTNEEVAYMLANTKLALKIFYVESCTTIQSELEIYKFSNKGT